MKMRYAAIVLATATALSACTTAEKTITGTAAGAAVGGALTNSVGGAVVGAVVAGFGTYLLETADGQCQYRNNQGQVYTTKCHWK
jgi:uncharacterized protein YcfJ